MATKEFHIEKSLRQLRDDPLFIENSQLVTQILSQVHTKIDSFAWKKGNGFDYTLEVYKHRERLHHIEGITSLTEELVKVYGEKYREVIHSQAVDHVLTDMGRVPSAEDYKDPDFWKNHIEFIKRTQNQHL